MGRWSDEREGEGERERVREGERDRQTNTHAHTRKNMYTDTSSQLCFAIWDGCMRKFHEPGETAAAFKF